MTDKVAQIRKALDEVVAAGGPLALWLDKVRRDKAAAGRLAGLTKRVR